MSDKEKKSKKSNKKKDKVTHKEKEREVVNHIQNEAFATTHFLYYPSTQEELRAFTLQFMCSPKFDYPIDSQNLYKSMQDEFRNNPQAQSIMKSLNFIDILKELEYKRAIQLQEDSLGVMLVDFIISVNYDKLHQLNREYFKERPKFKPSEAPPPIEEPSLKRPAPTQLKQPPPINPPYGHFMQPPLPLEHHPAKKEAEETKGPSALERALMDSTQEDQGSSTLERLLQERFQSKGSKKIDYCEHGTREKCQLIRNYSPCNKVHFRKIIKPHTDVSLGNCSYLDTCRHMDYCKFIHYELESIDGVDKKDKLDSATNGNGEGLPAQWINSDLRYFDFRVLGKFDVLMCDPPWDIHMQLPYGTLKDNEMKALRVDLLQDEGLIFLWVTGRAMELGRDCLQIWGYKRVEEMVWIKTNQLQRIIRTGRTGHWLNHSKEHCLIGIKGNPKINKNIDCDVVVSEVRETSRKPDEIYLLIERIFPGGRKCEMFARPHNRRPGWVSLGNQLPGIYLTEKDVIKRYQEKYPEHGITEESMEEFRKIENEEDTEYTYNNHITSGVFKAGAATK